MRLMETLKMGSQVHVHCYKHDGSLHRSWNKINFAKEIDGNLILANTTAMVTECDGRRWFAKEPAITIFLKDKWYNVICMLRSEGIHFYCNIASPYILEDNIITYIDYDLDVVRTHAGVIKVLDENEYKLHKLVMQYPVELTNVLESQLEEAIELAEQGKFPFDSKFVEDVYHEFMVEMGMK